MGVDGGDRSHDDARERLRIHLRGRPWAFDVDATPATVDFRLFPPDAWPDPMRADHLRVTRRSSVAFGDGDATASGDAGPVTEATLHLPPIGDEHEGAVRDALAPPDPWSVVFGSTRTDGRTRVYDGVATPHVHTDRTTTVETTIDVIESCVSTFEAVYDDGERVVRTER